MNSRRNKFLAQVAFYVLALGLMGYAASRTLEFVQSTMPADKQVLGYLYLLSTGVGALIWLYVFLTLADGSKQRGIAFVMGLIDLLGEMVLVYADTVRVSAEQGQMVMTASDLSIFITASVGIVGLNIVATYFFKMYDTDAEAKAHAKDLADEIRDATMKNLNSPEMRNQMAAELAPVLSQAVREQVTAEIHAAAGRHVLDAQSVFPGLKQYQTVGPIVMPDPTRPAEGPEE